MRPGRFCDKIRKTKGDGPMKRAKQLLNIAVSVTVGVYLGSWLFLWWDYRVHPELYALNSAPWYVRMISGTAIAAGLICLEVAVFLLARRIIKKHEQ